MEQKRLLLAFILSAAILLGWTYFVDRRSPQRGNANNSQPATANSNSQLATGNSPNPSPQSPAPVSPQPSPANLSSISAQDNVPQRTLTVATPLYEVKFDSRGAIATSWIIKENKNSKSQLFSVASDKGNHQRLELIPSEKAFASASESAHRAALATPLRLLTGEDSLDDLLATKNYSIDGVGSDNGDARLDLDSNDLKSINFVMRDEATGTEVTKTFHFDAENYSVGLDVKLARRGQTVPYAKLVIGPSIGDQGVPHYSFYSIAPEGVVATNDGKVNQYLGKSIHENKDANGQPSPDFQSVGGLVEWIGIGDTYFSMVAIPPRPAQGLEFHTAKYEREAGGKKEDRYLISAALTIPTDGSTTVLYVGPKDLNLLNSASAQLSKEVGREINLDGLINYGFLSFVKRPLAWPILKSIKWLHDQTGSYGVAVILFTIIIYSLFFPLKWRSSKSMRKAQKLAPRMKELQEKIKGMKQTDPRLKELQIEQLRLMKEGNPLGGCLPLLIQMPFLYALYSAITISIDFRQASFLWVPDLSAADPHHLLPILMAGSMVILQFITPQPAADPLQRKMMAFVLPAFMLYMLWSAPAGLLVYWLVGNIVGFGQQVVINRLIKTDDDEEPQQPKKTEPRPPKNLGAARVSQV